jgi:transposase
MIVGDELFEGLPVHGVRRAQVAGGAARMREPVRDQIELRAVDLDSLIGQDHAVRVIWSYVEGLDLSALEDRIKARAHRPGHPPISPRLLLALWLYASSDGVGSARALDRLCGSHDVYRWLCGGVSVNYHTLADFRIGCADLLDRLLAEHLAALADAGLVTLDRLAQDGVRIRASAGAASFGRKARLDRHLSIAEAVVDQLKHEVDARSDASNQRIKAARERAARERGERVRAAQAALDEIKRQRQAREEKRGNGKKPKEPRASSTDAQARVMKMADGGFRPGYNVQVASVAGEQFVVGLDVTNVPIAASCGPCWSGCARSAAICRGAISPMAAFAAPKTSNGRTAKGLRSFVRPPSPSTEPIPTCRGTATVRGCQTGGPAWQARRARLSTKLARSANASMPAGVTGTCDN